MSGNTNSGRPRYHYPKAVGERVMNAIATMADYDRIRNAAYQHARSVGQVFQVRRLCNQIAIRREQ